MIDLLLHTWKKTSPGSNKYARPRLISRNLQLTRRPLRARYRGAVSGGRNYEVLALDHEGRWFVVGTLNVHDGGRKRGDIGG